METAARLRPALLSQSAPASGRFIVGRRVLERLLDGVRPNGPANLHWELRILDDELLNAFSSPDGTIYVGRSLAQSAGTNPGLWAAILSHEVAHLVRRDWARRYLFEKSLREADGAVMLIDRGLTSGGWMDTRAASEALAQFCRQTEVEADAAGLMLMASAGYHPDFVPALHHLLQAQVAAAPTSALARHPRWETRDRELERAYAAAGLEFDRFWPDRYESPGGNPPIVVFVGAAAIRTVRSDAWEIQVPIRCDNLAGAVEVVLRTRAGSDRSEVKSSRPPSSAEGIRQLTGCTSIRTVVTFAVDASLQRELGQQPADIYVLDDRGGLLSRAELPRTR
jgi:hypothetical protein